MLHAMPCRIVCDLGGHLLPSRTGVAETSIAERARHHIRELFWVCYVLDKDIALRSGKPPLLVADYCDLALPVEDGQTDRAQYAIYPDELRLSVIKEQIYRLLYSPGAFNIPDSQHLLRIRHLDDELESWRLSIPSDMRPMLTIPTKPSLVAPDTRLWRTLQRIDLQLEYHYTLTTIHATVRRCGAAIVEGEGLPDDLHKVVHSSIDLTLEAGRSTMTFLTAPLDELREEAFW